MCNVIKSLFKVTINPSELLMYILYRLTSGNIKMVSALKYIDSNIQHMNLQQLKESIKAVERGIEVCILNFLVSCVILFMHSINL